MRPRGRKKPRKIPEVLTQEEQARMLGELEPADSPRRVRNLALLRLMLDTGLRASEVRLLRHRDLDLKTGRLWVREGKGKKDRGLWFNSEAKAMLLKWLDVKGRSSHNDYIFTALDGVKPICGRWLRKMVARLADKAGIAKRIHPHTLRHTFATDLYEQTQDLLLVKDAMGHEDIATTTIYTQISNKRLEQAMKNLRNGGVTE
jgi:integrase/recombinase XerD